MKNVLKYALAALMFAGAVSCAKDPQKIEGHSAALSFSFKTPQAPFVTRADIATSVEWDIDAADIRVYAAAATGDVMLLEEGVDYEIGAPTATEAGSGSQTYHIVIDQDWIDTPGRIGETYTFYFVANGKSSGAFAEGTFPAIQDALDDGALPTGADFVNSLTDALPDNGSGLVPIAKPDGATTRLLFSVSKELVLTGKIVETGELIRREARFDIENPNHGAGVPASDIFVVTNVYIADAPALGPIFGSADPTVIDPLVTYDDYEALNGAGLTYDDMNPEAGYRWVAQSVFYLYPTTIKADGTGTQIIVEGTLGGQPILLPVVVSEDTDILANHRYTIRLEPGLDKSSVIEDDWYTNNNGEDNTLPTEPGENAAQSVVVFADPDDAAAVAAAYENVEWLLDDNDADDLLGTLNVLDGPGAEPANMIFTTTSDDANTTVEVKYIVGGLDNPISVTTTLEPVAVETRALTWKNTFEVTVGGGSLEYMEADVIVRSNDDPDLDQRIRVRRFTGGEANILYLDGGMLKVGKWGTNVNSIDKMPYFKFGGIVGIAPETTSDTFDAATDIAYNPSDVVPAGTANEGWLTIPQYVNADFVAGKLNVSDPEYHNLDNVKAGKGDPCKLAGLSIDDIKKGKIDNKQWRLPTVYENIYFVNGTDTKLPNTNGTPVANYNPNTYWTTWRTETAADPGVANYNWRFNPGWVGDTNTISPGHNNNAALRHSYPQSWSVGGVDFTGTPVAGTATTPGLAKFPVENGFQNPTTQVLPAAGYRAWDTGVVYGQGTGGYYWASTPYDGSYGYNLYFHANGVWPVSRNYYAHGFSVRCLAQ